MNVMNVMKRNYENFVMETFYSTKNDFQILDIVTESGFVLQFFEAAINLAPIDVLCILDDQYIIKSDLSSSVKFRSNFLQ